MLMIYGKRKGSRFFYPMDMNEGQPVKNKIYATVYDDNQKTRLEKSLVNLNAENPDWTFELRHTN